MRIRKSPRDFGQKIGGGAYGEVFINNDICPNGDCIIKTVTDLNEFISERDKMVIIKTADPEGKYHCRLLESYTYMEGLKKSYALIYENGGIDLTKAWDRRTSALELCSDLQQIFIALEYFNSKGIVHFDIKPHNIVKNMGRIKLIDFGMTIKLINPFSLLKKLLRWNKIYLFWPDYFAFLPQGEVDMKSYLYYEKERWAQLKKAVGIYRSRRELETMINLYKSDQIVELAKAEVKTFDIYGVGVSILFAMHENGFVIDDPKLKDLVMQMVKLDPRERPTFEEIKSALKEISSGYDFEPRGLEPRKLEYSDSAIPQYFRRNRKVLEKYINRDLQDYFSPFDEGSPNDNSRKLFHIARSLIEAGEKNKTKGIAPTFDSDTLKFLIKFREVVKKLFTEQLIENNGGILIDLRLNILQFLQMGQEKNLQSEMGKIILEYNTPAFKVREKIPLNQEERIQKIRQALESHNTDSLGSVVHHTSTIDDFAEDEAHPNDYGY